MHWWFSATSALCAAVRPRLGTDQHVCTMGRMVSAPSGHQWGAPCLPAALDLEDEEWAPWVRAYVCVCVCLCFSHAPERTNVGDTAISQDTLVMFGDGGLWIGLCARIQNRPMYQLADILGGNQYCPPPVWWRLSPDHPCTLTRCKTGNKMYLLWFRLTPWAIDP